MLTLSNIIVDFRLTFGFKTSTYFVMHETNYRELLKEELLKRLQKNKKYSLRAFAKDLNIEPSQLSRVINGKQNISTNAANFISQKIYKTKKKRELFINLVNYTLAKNPEQKLSYLKRVKTLSINDESIELQLDSLKVIADWYHIALLDLLALENIFHSVKAFASFLGITEFETSEALKRLLKLGLIEKQDDRYVKTNRKLKTPSNIFSTSIRKFHKQMIDKAKVSIENQKVSERYLTSKTMTINKKDYENVTNLINSFNQQLNKYVDHESKKDSLYQLNIQFFNLKEEKR